MSNFFLNNMPQAVSQLMTDLRVMLDRRNKVKPTRTKLGDNVVSLREATENKDEDWIMEKYQELAGPVKDFFFKNGEELTQESFLKFMNELAYQQKALTEGLTDAK